MPSTATPPAQPRPAPPLSPARAPAAPQPCPAAAPAPPPPPGTAQQRPFGGCGFARPLARGGTAAPKWPPRGLVAQAAPGPARRSGGAAAPPEQVAWGRPGGRLLPLLARRSLEMAFTARPFARSPAGCAPRCRCRGGSRRSRGAGWRLQAGEELIDGQDEFLASYISFHRFSSCSASLPRVFLGLPALRHAPLNQGMADSPCSPGEGVLFQIWVLCPLPL